MLPRKQASSTINSPPRASHIVMTELKRPFDSLDETTTLGRAAGQVETQGQGQTEAQKAEQAKIKRTRIRQACERCKSRKTKV